MAGQIAEAQIAFNNIEWVPQSWVPPPVYLHLASPGARAQI